MDCILIRRDDPPKFNPLEEAVMGDVAPSVWCGPHVGTRLAEAMRTLRLIAIRAVAGYGAPWPGCVQRFTMCKRQSTRKRNRWLHLLQRRLSCPADRGKTFWTRHELHRGARAAAQSGD